VTSGDRSLEGRSIVVTGASRGIGLAVARVLSAAGATLFCLSRSGQRLDDAVASLGYSAVAVPCDLTNAQDVDRAVESILGGADDAPDALIQAAGVFPLAPFDKTPASDFDAAMRVNLLGPYRLAQPLAARMVSRGSGHIVTIGSVADRTAFAENVAYSASKFGARAVHEVMREELRGSGVRVSLVSPGPVDTTIWDAIDPDHRPGFTPRARMLLPEAVADAVWYVLTRDTATNIDELRLSRS
jgi:NADP-dependent 3-hydroxy acid dehydrogenase YdfG